MQPRSALGPSCVGARVVVRRQVPGKTGPSGGPAMTDVLGVMESWDAGVTRVRRADGVVVTVAVADIVSGKPVPPRPSVRMRVSAAEAERVASAGWPAPVTELLGDWVLRAAGGFSTRANSALVVGSPGCPLGDALAGVVDFYARHDLPALAQVVSDSDEARDLLDHGWRPVRPGEADTELRLGSVAQLRRVLTAAQPSVVPEVSQHLRLTPGWLATDDRAREHGDAATAVLEGASPVTFATVGDPVVARARASVSGDWVGVTDVWVAPDRRREGLAVAVLASLVGWAAERGATTAYLQVRGDHAPATALYDRLDLRVHHRYQYLRSP